MRQRLYKIHDEYGESQDYKTITLDSGVVPSGETDGFRIDSGRVHDFSMKKSFDDVCEDIRDKYKITNLLYDDDEAFYALCEALFYDYESKIANYESYIKEEMDARLLMELRKSAVLPASNDSFYEGHGSCKSIGDIE